MPIALIKRQQTRNPHSIDEAPTLPMDMDFGLDTDMDITEGGDKKEAEYNQQMVLDILDSVLDLIPVSPRLERLSELLNMAPFEGWAQEVDRKVKTKMIL